MWANDDAATTFYPTDEEGDLGLRQVQTCPSSVSPKDTIKETSGSDSRPTTALEQDDENTPLDDNIESETTGIAFADNIERQREMARQRLEQDRRFKEVLDKLAHNQEPRNNEEQRIADEMVAEEEIDRIMREPIDKSQLTREQRYRIGGAEYRALDILVKLVPAYYLGIVILFAFFFRIYIACSTYAQDVLRTTNSTGPIDPWFFSFFQALSAFNNLGIMLCDASMVPFQNAPAPLIFTMLLILFGNTAYAILLRFIIWCTYKLTPHSRPMLRETLRYMLDHPRRCYTTLFPSTQTYWLLLTLVVITVVELVCFLALNYWLPVLDGLNWGSRFIDGLFQSISTRNAGFAVINLMDLNPGTQLVYIVAMYISVYPVAISMRNSNVYQERALGIYRGLNDDEEGGYEQPTTGPALLLKLKRHPTVNSVMTTGRKVLRRPDFFVVTQVQRQLSSDISWLLVGLFIIIVAEAQRIMDPSPITVWTIIYESVSGFGNVGASQGYPDASVSQAGEYRTIRRHRGLPASIDRAVMLPSDQLEEREIEEQAFRRRNTVVSQTTNSAGSAPSFPNALFHSKTSF
ncbi:cation transport protein-domain-containing protein [Halteromyces radiatus]|uniref:cation transport protein-domain-containing protein n=1 Tax=Halteromyces radiatus TaxID=101107 RepID=UPI00221F2BFF|nr:cation transport protein-domain-containing protein [Halteromyces radiatus]KAI8098566.1 cation transport protein-domain-containing protein [Halteromyces radiatus]